MANVPKPLPTPELLAAEGMENVARILAEQLKTRASDETYIASLAEKQSYSQYAAFMLWDLIVHGKAHFADGRTFTIDNQDEWLKTVRFVFQHLDGPAKGDANFNGVNIFKVYAGFDPDLV